MVHDVFFVSNAFKLDFYLRYVQLMTRPTTMLAQATLFLSLYCFEQALKRNLVQSLGMKKLHAGIGLPYLFKYNPRPGSRFWKNRDYSEARQAAPPAHIATGWHDLFLTSTLNDYKALVEMHGVGHSRLTIGPWHHLESITSGWAFTSMLRSSVEFLQEKTGLKEPELNLPVRLWIMGARAQKGGWREFSAWPPNEISEEFYVLKPGALQQQAHQRDDHPASQQQSRFRYDPLAPTPALGGSVFSPMEAGERPQAALEAREDVACFDSEPLGAGVTVVGCTRLRLTIRASRPYFDIFARLSDVHPSGESFNVCDAVLRHRAPATRARSQGDFAARGPGGEEGPFLADVELTFAATAKCFEAGHTIRLVVTGGAFPMYARHFGDAEQVLEPEPLEVHPCDVEILHTEQVPSALWLPVLSGQGSLRSLSQAAATRGARRMSRDFTVGLRKVQSEAKVSDL